MVKDYIWTILDSKDKQELMNFWKQKQPDAGHSIAKYTIEALEVLQQSDNENERLRLYAELVVANEKKLRCLSDAQKAIDCCYRLVTYGDEMELLLRFTEYGDRPILTDELLKNVRSANKQRAAGKKGHEKAHGSPQDKAKKKQRYIDLCHQLKREHPNWKLGAIRQAVADKEGVCLRTVERYTGNIFRKSS
ncbi:hypothetical protein [Candidatus Thiodiazotropha sp. LNASS1]|uniref:hypothetical protein n=1 Tax=Candidatus Thiodiazotropha sp. LNASS1 TaxID=3096260 RepID=UPI0034E0518F